MRVQKILLLGVLVAVLAGCSMQYPQNAAEFRKMLPESTFGTREEITSSRSLAEITATFRKMAPQCLDVGCSKSAQIKLPRIVTHYKPTVIASPQKVELQQMEHEKVSPAGAAGRALFDDSR
jgi:hypothetical protein